MPRSNQLPADARERISLNETNQLYRTVRTGMFCVTAAAIAWAGFEALKTFAGKDTNLSVAATSILSAFLELKVLILVTLSGTCAAWALIERGLRHRKVEFLQVRIKQLETRIDPGRTTSNLTPKGKTNPKDR